MIETETKDQKKNREAAFFVFGNCDDGSVHPNDAFWETEYFPVEELKHLHDDASNWLEEEINNWKQDYGKSPHWEGFLNADNFQQYLDENCDGDPVISIDLRGKLQIWDGWHRIACAIVRGERLLKVCIGRQYTPTPGQFSSTP